MKPIPLKSIQHWAKLDLTVSLLWTCDMWADSL